MSEKPLVLVTGGTGFLAIWVIVHLYKKDYRVRTTVRSLSRADGIKAQLREAGIEESKISSLEVYEADLLKDGGWTEAMKGVMFVQHVASPFPSSLPKHENDLIIPARDGTLRVLRAARDAKSVHRVVVTSSFAAIAYGHDNEYPELYKYTEKEWSNLESKDTSAYPKSKTLAEQAAWNFIEKEGGSLELTVINPVGIFGPVLGKDVGTSARAVTELLEGSVPGIPQLSFQVVDVRDCADLHLRAMKNPNAKGERFIGVGEGTIWMADIAKLLRKNLGDKAQKVPKFVFPNSFVRILSLFMPVVRLIVKELGKEKLASNAKAKEILGWQWQYNNEEAIMALANSLIKLGAVKI
ncbi:putative NAD dependent epimerase/dehydratase [Talaromyces proteolyticus]|uniref:NAD dependent epimerase/dehydratase n=1 Tax=Talaromyces proteolyticus TaxID=1131652 RepID=A0AAD4KPE3_9EURO|nr:putative NAD dependent epimerase/dehydratase [Talaromyces proteolyticus]KAH8695288.1 putative NAD dependent epimerase/dehydratase [Talaromyces proteolyticus]